MRTFLRPVSATQFALRPGEWHMPGINASSNGALGVGTLRAAPYWFGPAAVITDLGVEVTVAGSTGALVRITVHLDDGTGTPGGVPGKPVTLLVDAGTVDATTTGFKLITGLTVPVPPGSWPYLGGTVQGAPATQPTLRTVGTAQYLPAMGTATPTALSAANIGYSAAGVTGAAPASFGAATLTGAIPRVAFRIAA